MFTYKVVLPNSSFEIIEAEYFSMTYDGENEMNAYFYVRKPVDSLDDDMPAYLRRTGPMMYEEIMVGYANNPRTVSYTDKFVYQPQGNYAQTEALDKANFR